MIDRLVHHAEVLTLTGDSYRTRARREPLAKDRAGREWAVTGSTSNRDAGLQREPAWPG
ncbi:ATP-binding protein [Streptomyces griseorubiginosus]|uniref:ATP-binding protein n=1 Tax=Streptomyces griseorubiginosus TaxID=67304 RepID=UPI0036E6D55C